MKNKKIKRTFDLVISFLALFYFSAFWVVIIIILFFSNKGKVFYIQKRLGKDCQEFNLIKFCTLQEEKISSRFSYWLRITALDEFPQLFNILWGQMSFVGPRALVKQELWQNPKVRQRSRVKPGLTGPTQITISKEADIDTKIKTDLWYINNCNLLLDIKIILISLINTLFCSWESNFVKAKRLQKIVRKIIFENEK